VYAAFITYVSKEGNSERPTKKMIKMFYMHGQGRREKGYLRHKNLERFA